MGTNFGIKSMWYRVMRSLLLDKDSTSAKKLKGYVETQTKKILYKDSKRSFAVFT